MVNKVTREANDVDHKILDKGMSFGPVETDSDSARVSF